MKVVGVDVSLTKTGLAWRDEDRAHPRVALVESAADNGTLPGRSHRLRRSVSTIWRVVHDADLVVIEQPAYSQTTGKSHDRSGLWWLLVARLTANGVPVAEVSPTALKTYALGKGAGAGTGKDQVLAAVVRRYSHVNVTDNNEADAVVLWAMGHRCVTRGHGDTYDQLSERHTRAMAAVAWPLLNPTEGATT